jgi:parallel beta-helix repeat protein
MTYKIKVKRGGFLLGVILIILFCINLVSASYLNVCSSGCDYTTIQSAINNASDGDTINVSAEVYTEALIINRSVILQGAGSSFTTITGQQTISVSNVTVDGFTFSGTVIINDVTNAINGGTLSNNTFTGTSYGIRIGYGVGLGVSNIIIRNNQIVANTNKGILFYDAGDYLAQRVSYITVDKNVIANNSGSGISTYGTGYNTITNNNVSDNKGNGISIKYDNEDIVRGNIVRNNSAMGINIHQVTNSTIENNTVFNHINNEVVTTFWGGSIIAGKGSAIYIHEFSQGNIIRFNELRDNKNGILVSREGSSNNPLNNSINENKITGNSIYAILNALANPSSSVNALNNWWGTVDEETLQSNISDNVSFVPYYLNEGMTILGGEIVTLIAPITSQRLSYPATFVLRANTNWDALNCIFYYKTTSGWTAIETSTGVYNFTYNWNLPCYNLVFDVKAICDGIESNTAYNVIINTQRICCPQNDNGICGIMEGAGAGTGLVIANITPPLSKFMVVIVIVGIIGVFAVAVGNKIREMIENK